MGDTDFAAMRSAMVDSQLRTSDVNDPAVIAAMGSVAREDFVPNERRASAYIDRPVSLGNGRALNPPLATGRLLTEAQINPGDKVLLIGGASGYCAAVLAEMGAQVTSVESDTSLGAKARAGVTTISGPLEKGAAKGVPYDVLIIDGAIEEIPAALAAQLADDARICVGIVENNVTRLCVGRKAGGVIGLARRADIDMVVLPGFVRPKAFTF
ncbi:protein-L-isoaspartate O-methyltransferase family protein [Sphingobium subterraneum]|uniref:Protein-L-isoaspartate O-methyltransferase n=1 Tax=Sphingobium subterraneum TaxID=627688 RepID=A0A841IV15_9SPHN|nr:protein-L-isoaspartate O-methyltransferase [Sphingobium subterraneum]MBB6122517.1 protein-L-isoaspartate(D-aspartate) O-methyltransferase [Sphingobium subterraneum]